MSEQSRNRQDRITELSAKLRQLEAEVAELDDLRDRMADILRRTAIALRGPEPELTSWSWHDLPERAATAAADAARWQSCGVRECNRGMTCPT